MRHRRTTGAPDASRCLAGSRLVDVEAGDFGSRGAKGHRNGTADPERSTHHDRWTSVETKRVVGHRNLLPLLVSWRSSVGPTIRIPPPVDNCYTLRSVISANLSQQR